MLTAHSQFIDELEEPSHSPLISLPNGWKSLRLGDHVSKIGSGVTPRGGSTSYLKQGIPLIRSQNVHMNRFVLNGLAFISAEQDEIMASSRVQPRDVLLNITGASIGRICIVPSELCPANVNQHVSIIRCNDSLDANYLAFYLAQQEFQKSILDSQAGATRQALTKELIENFIIAAPPLAEQKRIAKILKAQLATVDQARTAAEAQLNAAKALPAVYLRDIFRPEHTTGWTRGHIGEVTDIMPGQHILESDYNREKRGIGYLTGPADFGQFRAIVSKWTEKPKVFCEPRDVLVTVKGAGVGKINFALTERCAIGRQLMAVRPKNGALEQTFLFYSLFIKFRDLQAAALGATVPGLGRDDISNLEIAAPHIDEQRRIIALMTQRLEYSGP